VISLRKVKGYGWLVSSGRMLQSHSSHSSHSVGWLAKSLSLGPSPETLYLVRRRRRRHNDTYIARRQC
jgi:hypothetical protein